MTNEAACAIENFELYARNYESAWNHLKRRYQDEELIVHNQIRSILDSPKINREFYSARLLDSLQIPVESWNSILIYIVTTKFNADTMKENIIDKYGKTYKCTALLDCSQSSFISESLCLKLELPIIPTDITVKGIHHIEALTLSKTTALVISMDSRFERIIEFLPTPEVTGSLPGMSLPRACFPSFKNVPLADPFFHQSKPIDVSLGIDVYWDIMTFERMTSLDA